MFKRLFIILINIVNAAALSANVISQPMIGIMAYRQPAAASGDSEIVYYFNCDSASTPQTPQKGTNQVTVDVGISAVAGVVGNALDTNGTTNDGNFTIPTSSLLSGSEGAIGFYLMFDSIRTSSLLVRGKNSQATPRHDMIGYSGGGGFEFYYESSLARVTGLSNSTQYYIVLRWSNSNSITGSNSCALEVYNSAGSLVGSDTCGTGSGSPPTLDTDYNFANVQAQAWNCTFDQLMMSTNVNKDLTSVRDSTNP